jgi:DnaJ-domain-containing protein 1
MTDGAGNSRWVSADLVDVIDGGCGLALMTVLRSGSTVTVRGNLATNCAADHLKAAVRWCVGKSDGTFRAGLEFLTAPSTSKLDHPDTLDCYEVMQLSPNADAETISRVYRLLAARYHPDNRETGDSEKFIRLCDAHQILSDPAKRARYDARRRYARQPRRESVLAPTSALTANQEDERKCVPGGTKIFPRGRTNRDQFPPSVGTLRGWNSALGYTKS